MKRTVKCIAFFAGLALYAALLPFSAAAAEIPGDFYSEKQFLSVRGDDYRKNIGQAQSNAAKIEDFFPKDSTGEPAYPDFIGGIYFNVDGNMILQIVEKYTSTDTVLYNRVNDFAAQADGIAIENVMFSVNELKATMDTLNALYLDDKRPEAFGNVDSFAEDTINNRVEVRLNVFNEAEIMRFKRDVLDSPSLAFTESIGKYVPVFGEGESQLAIVQPQRSNTPLTPVIVLSIGLLGVLLILFVLKRGHDKRDNSLIQSDISENS